MGRNTKAKKAEMLEGMRTDKLQQRKRTPAFKRYERDLHATPMLIC